MVSGVVIAEDAAAAGQDLRLAHLGPCCHHEPSRIVALATRACKM